MKILYHHRTMGRGAEGVHIVNMVAAFEGLGNQVKIISPPSVDPLREAGRSVFQVESRNLQGIGLILRYVNIFIRKFPQLIFETIEFLYNIYALFAILFAIKRYDPDLFYERYAFFFFCWWFNSQKKRNSLHH